MRSCLYWLFSIQWSSHSETWQQRPRLWSRLRNVNASWQFLSLISTRAVICQRMLITSLSPAGPLMGNKRNAREGQTWRKAPPQCFLCPPFSVRLRRPGPGNGESRAHCPLLRPGSRTRAMRNGRRELRAEQRQCPVSGDQKWAVTGVGWLVTDSGDAGGNDNRHVSDNNTMADTIRRSENWGPRYWGLRRGISILHSIMDIRVLSSSSYSEKKVLRKGLNRRKRRSDIKILRALLHTTIRWDET